MTEAAATSPWIWGVGRRKTAVARVRLRPGTGRILVNRRDHQEYFPLVAWQQVVEAPLVATGTRKQYDVYINVRGGGPTGQAGACAMGIARALKADREDLEGKLREGGFLTRDSRMKERKKYGRRGARRGFQFSKR